MLNILIVHQGYLIRSGVQFYLTLLHHLFSWLVVVWVQWVEIQNYKLGWALILLSSCHVSASSLFLQFSGSSWPVGFHAGAWGLDVDLALLLAPLAPLLFLLQSLWDSEQITAAESLLVLQEVPRVSQLSLLIETIAETQDISQTQDFSRDDAVIIPRRTPTADPRPYLRLTDPAAVTLPLHSTPGVWAIRCTGLTWNAVCFPSLRKSTLSSWSHAHSPFRLLEVYTGSHAGNRTRAAHVKGRNPNH